MPERVPGARPRRPGARPRRPGPCRVWIFNHYAAAPDRPAGTRHYALARAVVRRGGAVTIFAAGFSHGSGREVRVRGHGLVRVQRFDDVPFVWLRTFPYRGNTWRRMLNMASYAVLAVLAQVGRTAPDVVVGSTVHPFAALAAWLVARLRGARFIFEVRDLWPQTLVDLGALRPTGPGARLLWAIEAFLVRRAETVITVLPGMVDYLESRGLPSDDVRYLPNGVDLSEAERSLTTGAQERDDGVEALLATVRQRRAAGAITFVYLGAHGRVNRLDVVLRAFRSAVGRTGCPMLLLLVGDGPEKPALERIAADLGLRDVLFADPIPKLRVPELLASVDVGIIHATSTPVYRYGVSFNKLFDYMAARLPVAFACATANDPVEAAGAGLTIPPDDPEALARGFVRLAEADPAERRAMGEAGRRYLEREHDMARIGASFADLVGCVGPTPR